MPRQYTRYTKERLQEVVANSASFTEVCRKLDKKPVGGTITNIRVMCRKWEIDYSHMTGQGHNKGKRSNKRKLPEDRLVMGTSKDHRISADKLRRSLDDLGIAYKCNVCNNTGIWNGLPLVLEIDHIDEQYWNNTKENLQYLCPNCHAQKTKNARVTQLV